jgi:hypothetical protein
MSEPLIIQQQREVVRSVQRLAEQHIQDETEAEARFKVDREAAEQAFTQARETADTELRRALNITQTADRLVQSHDSRGPAEEIVPLPPPKLFETDLIVGIRISTAQMEALLLRIKGSFQDSTSSTLITTGIVVSVVVAIIAILLMPFIAGLGGDRSGWGYGLFAAMVCPLVVTVLIAGARATVLRPYSPQVDHAAIREHMAYVLYMHQVLVEEARSTCERRLNERQERLDETKERISQSFRQQLGLLEPLIGKYAADAATTSPEWSSPAWETWTPSHEMPHTICVGDLLAGVREDRLSSSAPGFSWTPDWGMMPRGGKVRERGAEGE